MLGRLLLSIGGLVLLFMKDKEVKITFRWQIYPLPFLIIIACFAILYAPTPILPSLIIEGEGPTALKNTLQYLAVLLHIVIIIVLLKNLKEHQK